MLRAPSPRSGDPLYERHLIPCSPFEDLGRSFRAMLPLVGRLERHGNHERQSARAGRNENDRKDPDARSLTQTTCHDRPSRRRPAFFLFPGGGSARGPRREGRAPPATHCLKKNATCDRRHWSRISTTTRAAWGRAPGLTRQTTINPYEAAHSGGDMTLKTHPPQPREDLTPCQGSGPGAVGLVVERVLRERRAE